MEYRPNDERTARAEFDRLDGDRQTMLDRYERLAQLTVPSVLPDKEYNSKQDQLTNGFTSLGSQCVTHLTNKLMNAMFAPSRPFFRLSVGSEKLLQLAQALGVDEGIITDALAQGERDAMAELEREGAREALYEGMTHLVTLGNVLMDMSGDTLQFTGIRDYVVRRNAKGVFTCLVIRECVRFEDLEEDVQKSYTKVHGYCNDHHELNTYKQIKLCKGMYRESFWVEDLDMGAAYSGKYRPENVPYRPLTWRLPLRQDYGVGRVEEYANDIATNDCVAEGLADGAILASQYKWLANPAGMTRPEDMTNSMNGAVVPGVEGDLALVFANIGQQLQTVLAIGQDYQRRLGAGFMLSSAVTRDAERVTAEEIKIQVMELESSLGGVYSRLALSIQTPLATWLIKRAKINIKGTQIKPVVITGLDALSRNGDLERMRAFLTDVTALDNVQPQTKATLNVNNIVSDMAAGNGVDKGRYVLPPAQQQQNQNQADVEALGRQAAVNTVDANTIPETQQ
ncbi:head-tail adaptor [Pseudomonas phage vB_PpuP-Villemi]